MRLQKVVPIFIALFILNHWPVIAAGSFEGLFLKGNQSFQAGDVELARDAYETIVKQGLLNSAVFYNLGNCYMKLGDPGKAVLNYRKALRLDHRDRDIRANLDIARQLVTKSGEIIQTDTLQNKLQRVAANMGAMLLSVATLATWWITAGLFLTGSISRFRRTRRRAFRAAAVGLIVCAGFGILLGTLIRDIEFTEHAVAVSRPVIARNGPGEHFTEVYEQLPGYEMVVHRQQSGWVEVTLRNGYTAWVPTDTIEKI